MVAGRTGSEMSSLYSWVRRLGADRRGVSAVEVALVLPLLALALCGVLEFGLNVYNRQQLQAAVQTGMQYALRNPNDTAGIMSAVSSALPANAGVEVSTPTYACECNDGGQISCSPLGNCQSGTPRRIMTVSVSRPPVALVSMLVGLRPSTLQAHGAVTVPPS